MFEIEENFEYSTNEIMLMYKMHKSKRNITYIQENNLQCATVEKSNSSDNLGSMWYHSEPL